MSAVRSAAASLSATTPQDDDDEFPPVIGERFRDALDRAPHESEDH